MRPTVVLLACPFGFAVWIRLHDRVLGEPGKSLSVRNLLMLLQDSLFRQRVWSPVVSDVPTSCSIILVIWSRDLGYGVANWRSLGLRFQTFWMHASILTSCVAFSGACRTAAFGLAEESPR